jgi:hypothetical protein
MSCFLKRFFTKHPSLTKLHMAINLWISVTSHADVWWFLTARSFSCGSSNGAIQHHMADGSSQLDKFLFCGYKQVQAEVSDPTNSFFYEEFPVN